MIKHNPHHPFVQKLNGCGHGVLFTDYCRDCEIVGELERYRIGMRMAELARARLIALGHPADGTDRALEDEK